MDMSSMSRTQPASEGMSAMDMSQADLNDVEYDAFLTNDRTLDDPEIFDVEHGSEVRLRIINAAASARRSRMR
jgi:hypothetical protein